MKDGIASLHGGIKLTLGLGQVSSGEKFQMRIRMTQILKMGDAVGLRGVTDTGVDGMSLFQQLLDDMTGKESIRTRHENFHSLSSGSAYGKKITQSQKDGMKNVMDLIHIAAKMFGRPRNIEEVDDDDARCSRFGCMSKQSKSNEKMKWNRRDEMLRAFIARWDGSTPLSGSVSVIATLTADGSPGENPSSHFLWFQYGNSPHFNDHSSSIHHPSPVRAHLDITSASVLPSYQLEHYISLLQ
jgi:hypothetical protein